MTPVEIKPLDWVVAKTDSGEPVFGLGAEAYQRYAHNEAEKIVAIRERNSLIAFYRECTSGE